MGNREGRDDVRRAARVLELAVGAALGAPSSDHDRTAGSSSLASEVGLIPPDDRHRCRLLYQYRDVWEPLLRERGLSRSQALTLIKLQRQADGEQVPRSATVSLAAWEDWLTAQPQCDLLLTDPPYMTDVPDIGAFARAWLPQALAKVRPTGRAYICIGAYPDELEAYRATPRAGLTLAQRLTWTYRNTLGPAPAMDYKQNGQDILYFRGADAGPLDCPLMTEQFTVHDINAPDGRQGDRYHAWQKPAELGERFIRHATTPGDLVLDPFAGTGTFLLAAARLGRDALGCDVDPAQVDLCVRRGCRDGCGSVT